MGKKGLTKPLTKSKERMSPLQKLTTEHAERTERTERVRFMNKRIIFWPLGACNKNFYSPIFDER
jgi:hypothetical protein